VNLGDVGVKDEEARITFMSGVAIMGTDEQDEMLHTSSIKVLKDETFTLEVVSITASTPEIQEMYKMQNKQYAPKLSLEPLGILTCRTIYVNDFHQYDLPKDKYPQGCLPRTDEGKEYTFWVEDSVLEECFVGMKIDARVLTLEGGITVLDEVKDVMCSFYRWLPNELLMTNITKKVVIRKREDEDEEQDEVNGEQHGGKTFADDDSDMDD
jgi:hypothetical protein